MNRTIKFRGKRIDNGEWVIGDLTTEVYPVFPGLEPPLILDLDGAWEVDPATVGQFTGLHDKNGKEIYEGDVVKVTHEGETHWHNKHTNTMELHCDCGIADVEFYASMWYLNGDVNNSLYEIHDSELKIEIIGNTHENPELIQDQQ
jgi:uncharacterized phage protein (TIGR01671 family)